MDGNKIYYEGVRTDHKSMALVYSALCFVANKEVIKARYQTVPSVDLRMVDKFNGFSDRIATRTLYLLPIIVFILKRPVVLVVSKNHECSPHE